MTRLIVLLIAALCLAAAAASGARAQQAQTHWHGDYFPNVALRDHNGRAVHFYDDLIRNKVVLINFVYTTCTDICPLDTAQLRRVQQALGERLGRDIFMYSISINQDQPAALRRFMRSYEVGPNWTFLTASQSDVTLLQRRLGLRVDDPNNLRGHSASIVIGNETTGQWIHRSAYENPQNLVELLTVAMQNHAPSRPRHSQSYAAASEVTDTSPGAYLFRTRCMSCHTIGEGDRLGPDLAGVTAARARPWLLRWIREPDRMIAEHDPTAGALMARYRNLAMPNLNLSETNAADLVDYLRRRDAQRTAAVAQSPH